jgi:hypothetical protein
VQRIEEAVASPAVDADGRERVMGQRLPRLVAFVLCGSS